MFFKSMHYAFEMPIVNFIYIFFPSHSMSILKVPIKYYMKILRFVNPLKAGSFEHYIIPINSKITFFSKCRPVMSFQGASYVFFEMPARIETSRASYVFFEMPARIETSRASYVFLEMPARNETSRASYVFFEMPARLSRREEEEGRKKKRAVMRHPTRLPYSH
jgi:hypothetical protein